MRQIDERLETQSHRRVRCNCLLCINLGAGGKRPKGQTLVSSVSYRPVFGPAKWGRQRAGLLAMWPPAFPHPAESARRHPRIDHRYTFLAALVVTKLASQPRLAAFHKMSNATARSTYELSLPEKRSLPKSTVGESALRQGRSSISTHKRRFRLWSPWQGWRRCRSRSKPFHWPQSEH